MTKKRAIIFVIVAAVLVPLVYIAGIAFNGYGVVEDIGLIRAQAIPAEVRVQQDSAQVQAAKNLGVEVPKQILFGDLHVHTTFSSDAFRMSLPMVQGDGTHPGPRFSTVCATLIGSARLEACHPIFWAGFLHLTTVSRLTTQAW